MKQVASSLLGTIILAYCLPINAEPISRFCYFGGVKQMDLTPFPCDVEWEAAEGNYIIVSKESGKTYIINVQGNQPLIDWGNGEKEKATAFHTLTCSRYTGASIGSLALCRQ